MTSRPIDPYTGDQAPVTTTGCRLRLVGRTEAADMTGLRIAFASTDRQHVDQHFGAAEGFVIYEVDAEKSALVGVAEFPGTAKDGNESKLAAKIEFLAGCAAVFVVAIGDSAIQQLLPRGIQPIRVGEGKPIDELLKGIVGAMATGGVPWVERALAAGGRAAKRADRFDAMAAEGWRE